MPRLSRRFVLSALGSSALAAPFAAVAAAEASARRAPPVDQAPRDPALVRVRAAILEAAKARDFKRLTLHLDPRIKLDYGGGSGAAEFGRRLAKEPSLWAELVWVLDHGGRFERDGSYWAPYTFTSDAEGLDAFEAGIIVAENVPARAEPRADAPILATLRRQAIKVTDWRNSDKAPRPFYNRRDWVKIELPGKRAAWIEGRFVRSVVDFRAGFVRVRGVWKMNAFIAGD